MRKLIILGGLVGTLASSPVLQPGNSISGVVLAEPDGNPVAGALVTFSGQAEWPVRVLSGGDGRFRVDNLPTGRYLVEASKPAFLTTSYGSTRPGSLGSAVGLTGTTQLDLALHLRRGGSVSGTIRDEFGNGIPYAAVGLLDAAAELGTPGSWYRQTTADDIGQYRFFGLPSGSFLVAASPARTGAVTVADDRELDRLFQELTRGVRSAADSGISTTRSAGLLDSEAVSDLVQLNLGGSAAVDVFIRAGSSSVVTIQVLGALPAVRVSVELDRVGQTKNALPRFTGVTDADGRFQFQKVPRGDYLITARTSPQPGAASQAGRAKVAVLGGATSASVAVSRTAELFGTYRLGHDANASGAVGPIVVVLQADEVPSIGAKAQLMPDGSFRLTDVVPGSYEVRLEATSGQSSDWKIIGQTLDGTAIGHGAIPLTAGSRHMLELALGSSLASVSGRLVVPVGDSTEYSVVVFPVDDFAPRNACIADVSTNGEFLISRLLEGTYYLAVFRTEYAPALRSADTLRELAISALTIAVPRAGRVVQDVAVIR